MSDLSVATTWLVFAYWFWMEAAKVRGARRIWLASWHGGSPDTVER